MNIPSALLAWYKRHGRDLPWRHTRDPYPVLVSEIMLQQTQVSRGILFYERWLKQFPDWETLAQAQNAAVLETWAGLGYNRRALMLRDIAKVVVTHGLPKNEVEWRAIKGIGPYTAAAISIFSLGARTLPIDTNIRRVLGRVFLGTFFPDQKQDKTIVARTSEILPKQNFQDIPQALFDLATSICTKTPQCALCPLRSQCKAAPHFLAGTIETPKVTIKKAKEAIHVGKNVPDRIYRGKALAFIRSHNGVHEKVIGPAIDPTFNFKKDAKWMQDILKRLENDRMISKKGSRYFVSRE